MRRGKVISVTFGADGMFCTSDSPFHWRSQSIIAQSTAGVQIPVYHDPRGKTGYAICCGSAIASSQNVEGGVITKSFYLMWVGDMQQGPPDSRTFFKNQ